MDISLDRTALEALFDLPDNDGTFPAPLRTYLEALGEKRPAVMLVFPPKAAGTFLRTAAIRATGGELVRVVCAQGARDAQPYLPTFIAYYLGGVCAGPLVTHIHMQALPANTSFLEAFNIRPVIMIRNLPDMLASYWDMLEKSDYALLEGLNCTIPQNFRTMPDDRKADFLIDVLGPWFVGYYASWLGYLERESERVCVLTYGEFIRAPAETLKTLLQHAGIANSLAHCQSAIDAVWQERYDYRFNQGAEGRSQQYFSIRHRERIARMLSYYPSTASRRADLIGH